MKLAQEESSRILLAVPRATWFYREMASRPWDPWKTSVGNTIGPRNAPNPATPALPTPEAQARPPQCPPAPTAPCTPGPGPGRAVTPLNPAASTPGQFTRLPQARILQGSATFSVFCSSGTVGVFLIMQFFLALLFRVGRNCAKSPQLDVFPVPGWRLVAIWNVFLIVMVLLQSFSQIEFSGAFKIRNIGNQSHGARPCQ